MTTPTDTKFWQLLAAWRDSDPGAKREEAARAIDAHVQGLIDAVNGHTLKSGCIPMSAPHVLRWWQVAKDSRNVHAQCDCGEWSGGFADKNAAWKHFYLHASGRAPT